MSFITYSGINIVKYILRKPCTKNGAFIQQVQIIDKFDTKPPDYNMKLLLEFL